MIKYIVAQSTEEFTIYIYLPVLLTVFITEASIVDSSLNLNTWELR